MIYYDKTGVISGVLFLSTRKTPEDGVVSIFHDNQKEGYWRPIESYGEVTSKDDVLIGPMALSWWSE